MTTFSSLLIILGIILGYFFIGLLVLIAFVKWVDPQLVKDTGVRVLLWILWPGALVVEICLLLGNVLLIISDGVFKILHLDNE